MASRLSRRGPSSRDEHPCGSIKRTEQWRVIFADELLRAIAPERGRTSRTPVQNDRRNEPPPNPHQTQADSLDRQPGLNDAEKAERAWRMQTPNAGSIIDANGSFVRMTKFVRGVRGVMPFRRSLTASRSRVLTKAGSHDRSNARKRRLHWRRRSRGDRDNRAAHPPTASIGRVASVPPPRCKPH